MTPTKPDATEAAERATAYMIVFDDKDRAPEIWFGEAAARKAFASVSMNWNAHLFVMIESNSQIESHYVQSPTYAEQSAEIAELRAKLAAAEGERDDLLDTAAKLGQQVCRDKPRRDRLAKYDDATPINEAFCEANGATLTVGYVRTWKFPCGVEVIFGVGDFEVYLGDVLLETVTTIGQLRHLIDGLGVRS